MACAGGELAARPRRLSTPKRFNISAVGDAGVVASHVGVAKSTSKIQGLLPSLSTVSMRTSPIDAEPGHTLWAHNL